MVGGTRDRKLVVEVVDARGLLPKDGHGTSSPYVVIDFYGQRKRTRAVNRDLNPMWNEVLEFNVGSNSSVFGDMLELDVYHEKTMGPTRRNNFLGRIRLNSSQFVRKGEEALMYFPLEKKHLFSWIQGEIGLKIYYVLNESVSPPSATPLPPEEEAKCETPAEVPDTAAPVETKEEGTSPPEAPPAETPAKPDESNTAEVPQAPAVETPAAHATDADTPEKPNEAAKIPENVEPPPPNPNPSDATETPPAQTVDNEAKPDSATEQQQQPPPTPKPTPPPPVEMMPSMMSRSASDVKFVGGGGFNPGQPISRQATTDSFASWDTGSTIPSLKEKSSYDLVEKMHYLFVKIVKARSLPNANSTSPIVKISVSNCHVRTKTAHKTNMFYLEWNQTFAFRRETPESLSTMEISVWDYPPSPSDMFLGGICFDVTDIPVRDPPDSPLAPQWYRLEGGQAHNGDLMLATWIGTQADESFPDAWKTDTSAAAGSHMNSKVYLSPKLWYLRATVIEAQDIVSITSPPSSSCSFQVKAQLGFQVLKTKVLVTRGNGSPLWNEDLIFVAAEPLTSDHLFLSLQNRIAASKAADVVGVARITLATIERRVDDRKVVSRWFNLEDMDSESSKYRGRLHLRLCFDGGYHVMDESAHVCSDFRPTARQLWKPPIGTVELGILGCKNLLPMKTFNGRATTDAYSVAKYGSKWVRTRAISDTLDPRWNEQYTWNVYDPCTVLTVGVFDDNQENGNRMGKVRIRLSTLETGRVYRNTYPLLVLCPPRGLKKMGEIELAVRFVTGVSTLDLSHLYSQPMLPLMHHIKPLGVVQQDMLRGIASKMVAQHLSQSEPPLPREVILYMLDADSHTFSMRKVRANWFRVLNVVSGFVDVVRWVDDTCSWKNPTATLLVHALLVMLVWYPDLIVPTLAFYLFVMGMWNYRFRSRGGASSMQQHLDAKISQADVIDLDELDEEFDTVPSSRSPDTVRSRYDKLRTLGARVQTLLGDIAAQGERMQALVTWRDPRATGIFVALCFITALVLYLVPSKMVAMALGFYYLRHPMFRDRKPSPALNFFRRLPALTDRIM